MMPRGKDGRPALDPSALARLEIVAEDPEFKLSTRIRIEIEGEAGDLAEIRYTVDASDPTIDSPLYAAPFDIEGTVTVRAAIFRDGKMLSGISEATFERS